MAAPVTSAAYQTVWDGIVTPFQTAMNGLVPGLMGVAGPWFKLCVGAYLLCSMLIAAWNPDEGAVLRLFRNVFLASVVYAIAFTMPAYNYYVVGLVHGTVAGMSAAVTGAFPAAAAGPLGAQSFDVLSDKIAFAGDLIEKNSPCCLKGLEVGINISLSETVVQVAIFLLFAVYLVTSVVMIFVLGIAPMFVALYFFPFTRRYFDAWLGKVVAGMLSQIFIVALLSLLTGVMTNLLEHVAEVARAGTGGDALVAAVKGFSKIIGVSFVFTVVAGVVVVLAYHIGGATAAVVLPRLPVIRAAQMLASAASSGQSSSSQQPGGSGGGGGVGPHGPAPSGAPARNYAFNRHVGSAS